MYLQELNLFIKFKYSCIINEKNDEVLLKIEIKFKIFSIEIRVFQNIRGI